MDTKRRSYDIYDIEERVHALELGGGTSGGGSWDYSTDEVNTGQKWIDGKEIYCKVTNNLSINLSDWTNTTISSTDMDTIVDAKFMSEDRSYGLGPIYPRTLCKRNSTLWVLPPLSYAGTLKVVTVFYTKTEATKKRSTKK